MQQRAIARAHIRHGRFFPPSTPHHRRPPPPAKASIEKAHRHNLARLRICRANEHSDRLLDAAELALLNWRIINFNRFGRGDLANEAAQRKVHSVPEDRVRRPFRSRLRRWCRDCPVHSFRSNGRFSNSRHLDRAIACHGSGHGFRRWGLRFECVVTKVKERNSNRDEDVFSHSNTGGSNEEKPSPTRACVAKHLSSLLYRPLV